MKGLLEITANVKDHFFQKVHHPYVHSIIPKPPLNEDHAYLLAACMLSSDVKATVTRIENRLLATMLVEAALGTHDKVAYGEEQPLSDKQLTVLAGDYYSGLYYKLLSEENDVPFIRLLAEGIQEINELKIRYYQLQYNDIDELIDDVKMIEATLAHKICEYVHASSWKSWISNVLLFKRLLEEKRNWLTFRTSTVIESFWKLLYPHDQDQFTSGQEKYVVDTFNRVLLSVKQLVESGMSHLPENTSEIQAHVSSILQTHLDPTISFVEEG